jgi:hypothetical protein
MCRNHSHAVVTQDQGGEMEGGSVVHIAELANEEFTLEFLLTGEKLTIPRSSILCIVSLPPATASYSRSALMEVLAASFFVWDKIESGFMTLIPES